MAEKYPELLDEWDYAKNTLDPNRLTPKSGQKANWICKKCGYRWYTSISNRTSGHGCRICNAREGAKKRNAALKEQPR